MNAAATPAEPLSRRARRTIGTAVVVLLLIPILFVAAAILGRYVVHGSVDGESLSVSVGQRVGSIDDALGDVTPCTRTSRRDVWRCSMSDARSSGAVPYEVRVEPGGSCWTARRAGANGTPGRERTDGCVYAWQWSLLEHA